MHIGMAKQRLMRLIKCKKVLVREDFWQLSQKFLMLEERLNSSPGKIKKSTICRGTRSVTLQNFPIKHPSFYRYCNNLPKMNKDMPKLKKTQDVSHRDFSNQKWSGLI